eukprot:Nk52_evm1s272 gene=Nk52_evmTU1s272
MSSVKDSISNNNFPLAGKIVLITGASSGIGAAIATTLHGHGASVGLAARREQHLNELKTTLDANCNPSINQKVFVQKADVTVREQVKSFANEASLALSDGSNSDGGRAVDILVNCAGIMPFTLMKNLHEDEWEKMIDINCKGVLNSIGAVLCGMISRGQGHIVNMSSDAGRKAFPGLAVYSGTKFFVEGVSQGLRYETADTGIKVTCIQPGDVKTDLAQTTTDQEAKDKYGDLTGIEVLQTQDIANAVLYAVTQPPNCAVNDILIEPRQCPI